MLCKFPLLRVVQELKKERSRSTRALYGVVFLVSAWILLMAFLAPVQKMTMAKFHWSLRFFPGWCLLQFVPTMYNFENEVWIPVGAEEENAAHPSAGILHFWINHYPLHYVVFDRRPYFFENQTEQSVYFRSRYRRAEVDSRYLVDSRSGIMVLKRIPEGDDNGGPRQN